MLVMSKKGWLQGWWLIWQRRAAGGEVANWHSLASSSRGMNALAPSNRQGSSLWQWLGGRRAAPLAMMSNSTGSGHGCESAMLVPGRLGRLGRHGRLGQPGQPGQPGSDQRRPTQTCMTVTGAWACAWHHRSRFRTIRTVPCHEMLLGQSTPSCLLVWKLGFAGQLHPRSRTEVGIDDPSLSLSPRFPLSSPPSHWPMTTCVPRVAGLSREVHMARGGKVDSDQGTPPPHHRRSHCRDAFGCMASGDEDHE